MSLKMVPFESLDTDSNSHSTITNYGSILYHFREKARYCLKVWYSITSMVWLPEVKKFDMFSRFDTMPACVGQTDRQTDRHTVACASCVREKLNIN